MLEATKFMCFTKCIQEKANKWKKEKKKNAEDAP
jgi:hypothetical protein